MSEEESIKFHTVVKAEDSHKYPDMRLRLLIREACLNATRDQLTIDEALSILRDEADYLEKRIAGAK